MNGRGHAGRPHVATHWGALSRQYFSMLFLKYTAAKKRVLSARAGLPTAS